MKQVSSIEFRDLDSGDSGFTIVKADIGVVGLTISLQRDGDVEVFLDIATCTNLLAALSEAINIAKQ